MRTAYLLAHFLRVKGRLRVNARQLRKSLAVPTGIVIAIAFSIASTKSAQRRGTFGQSRERDESKQALVRYVQLKRQCSEEAAYQRLAAFVKKRVPSDDHCLIGRLLARKRQTLLALVQRLLVHEPDEIDEI